MYQLKYVSSKTIIDLPANISNIVRLSTGEYLILADLDACNAYRQLPGSNYDNQDLTPVLSTHADIVNALTFANSNVDVVDSVIDDLPIGYGLTFDMLNLDLNYLVYMNGLYYAFTVVHPSYVNARFGGEFYQVPVSFYPVAEVPDPSPHSFPLLNLLQQPVIASVFANNVDVSDFKKSPGSYQAAGIGLCLVYLV